MKRKTSILLLLSIFGLFLSVGCGKTPSTGAVEEYHDRIVLRFAETLPPEHPSARASQAFADGVYEKTGGRIEIRVQYNGELGSEQEAIEQLRFGGIAFARVSLLTLANEVDGLEGFVAAFAHSQPEEALAALERSADLVNHMLDREQMTLLTYLTPDKQCIANAQHDVKALEDIAGLRISIMSSRTVGDYVSGLSAFPVAMEEGAVLRSLNSEYIDGALLGFLEYARGNFSALMPYATLTSAFACPDMILAGTVSLGAIDNNEQELLQGCGRAVFDTHRSELEAAQQEALANLAAAGVMLRDGKTFDAEAKRRLRAGDDAE